jgi:predicted dehydrogenase
MSKHLKVCIIGNGIHSKRIQKILRSKKIKFFVYKPKLKKRYKDESLTSLYEFNVFFIISPTETHYHYIKSLYKKGYIFCEKPPTNNITDLQKLKKIRSNKIYYNFNFRFSKIAETLKKKNKLGKLIYANIISGHGLALKKDYELSWRSDIKKCPKGVFEMLSIHWLDLLNHLFKITAFNKPRLSNLSNVGNSYDNSNMSVEIENKFLAEIFSSYTSPLINKKIFVFDNGVVEENESIITIKGPTLNYDKNNFIKPPRLIKKVRVSQKKDYLDSLDKSVNFFLKTVLKQEKFSIKENLKSLKINSMIL